MTSASTTRRTALGLVAGVLALPGRAQQPRPDWSSVEARARGQTVYFNAWAGSERINAYLQWAAGELLRLHGVRLEHVKIGDAAEVVRRVRAERAAGRSEGSVDLVWINGENFLTMKRGGLLFGPFAESLPAYRYVDTVARPTTRVDFSEPVEGMEAPWGMAQLTFFADRRRVATAPTSMAALLDLARTHPGRLTYPRPPEFHGTTFVKQALLETAGDRALFQRPFDAGALRDTAPLWAYLDALHPHLWRGGRQFPQHAAAIRQMMADGELLIALTFNPNEAANEIAARRLAETVYSFQFPGGTIGNTHFLAIPVNARARDGAQVVANFLLSPVAQARKADIAQWGDPTVLAVERLAAPERALFASTSGQPGQLTIGAPTLPEPHGSWVDPLEKEWLRRYG